MDLVPDGREPTAAAELVIETRPAGDPEAGDADRTEIRKPRWLRWLLPTSVRVRIVVPGGHADRLLGMLERITFAIAWLAAVIGTLFGAAAAHLPPIGTTIVVVLEIVVPPLTFRRPRWR